MSIIGSLLLTPQAGLTQEQSDPQELRDVQHIVAVVNDSPISLYDLKQRVLLLMISSGAQSLTREEQQYLNQQALQSLIDDKLKIHEAEKYKTVISREEQDEAFAGYARQMNLSAEQLEQQLNRAGVRKESMLQQIEASLAWEQVVGGLLMPQVSISDEEIYAILDRLENNKGQDEYHPREIFLLVTNNDNRADTKAAAERIVEQLKTNKASFPVMARQFSQSTTAAVGGDLGWLMKSELNPEIASVLETMEKGQISDPVETDDGYYILQLVDKRQVLTVDETDAHVALRHLFFEAPEDASNGDWTALEASATAAADRIESCENLEEQGETLGATESGNLGDLVISDLPQNLHQPLLDADVGKATAPIREEKGFRVLVVCDRQEPQVRAPDYDSVENSLSQQRVGLIARRHLRDLRRDAIIDYK